MDETFNVLKYGPELVNQFKAMQEHIDTLEMKIKILELQLNRLKRKK